MRHQIYDVSHLFNVCEIESRPTLKECKTLKSSNRISALTENQILSLKRLQIKSFQCFVAYFDFCKNLCMLQFTKVINEPFFKMNARDYEHHFLERICSDKSIKTWYINAQTLLKKECLVRYSTIRTIILPFFYYFTMKSSAWHLFYKINAWKVYT